jgi:MoaA/NifB/PqqE/SkfB family radical SAM enzyme
MAKTTKSNFCIRPFNSSLIKTNGNIEICCVIQSELSEYNNIKNFSIKNTSINDWWGSDYLKYVRKNFLENKRLKECALCWKNEDASLSSHRTNSNYEYKAVFKHNYEKHLKMLGKNNLPFPEDLELQITNLCNLKCQMCSGASSSKLLVENNALEFESLSQKDYKLNESDYKKINELIKHDLSLINLRGGEPLFNKKVINLLLKLIENKKANNIKLHITTNGTICNKKILNILKNFKNVRLMFSIEGTEKCNDYMRFPSQWRTIKDNISRFKELNNVYIYINSVVQNLNILYINHLIDYCHENNFFLHLSKLNGPDYLDMLNLPKILLEQAYGNFLRIEKKKLTHTKNVNEIIIIIKKHLENYKFNEEKYQEFVDMIKKRDNYRKVNIVDYMPRLAKEIYK